MIHPKRRTPRRVANDAPTKLKHEIWRWAEEQQDLTLGPKAFLNHLADHADEEGRVYVVSRHFCRLMNASPRSITNYLTKLEAHELIVDTGDKMIVPSAKLTVYRLAPNDPIIAALIDGSEKPAFPAAPDKTAKLGNLDAGSSKADTQPSKTGHAYKENSTYFKRTETDVPARSHGNAGPGVESPNAVDPDPKPPAGLIPPTTTATQQPSAPPWLKTVLTQTLGEDWVATNLEGCTWTEEPNQLWTPSAKAERIYREARQILEKHNIKVVGTHGRPRA